MYSDPELTEFFKKLGQESGAFYFKHFNVEDDASTMKVGTDAVLLGIAIKIEEAENALEVGTGCGVIAMVLAQRSKIRIDALDMDEASVLQARHNIQKNSMENRIVVHHKLFQDYLHSTQKKYDIIFSNPPFFSRSFKSNHEKRNLSRHDDKLSFRELIEGASELLNPWGSLWVILPLKESSVFREMAHEFDFSLHYALDIIPKENREANRRIMQFKLEKADKIQTESICLRMADNSFSREYMEFAHDFYLDF